MKIGVSCSAEPSSSAPGRALALAAALCALSAACAGSGGKAVPIPSASGGVQDPADEFACLGTADEVVAVTGIQEKLKISVGSRQSVDAREALFKVRQANLRKQGAQVEVNSQNAIWIPAGSTGGCWAGGAVRSDFSPCASWQDIKTFDPAGISFGSRAFKLHGLYIGPGGDAIRVHDGADLKYPSSPANTKWNAAEDFEIAHVWAETSRDDCVENDALASGVIRDSLFDGCFTGFSTTPGMRLAQLDDEDRARARDLRAVQDGGSKTIVLDRVLLRMQLQPKPHNPERKPANGLRSGYGGGPLFKANGVKSPPRYAIRNSIFAFDGPARTYDFPPLKDCANNIIVWLGPGTFPGKYPEPCFKLTTDVGVWKRAVRDWHARHPGVGKEFKPAPSKMGDVSLVSCP